MRPTEPLPPTAVWVAAHKTASKAWLSDSLCAGWAAGTAIAAWPFDALRAQYAGAVRAGLVERSMLASRDFEQAVGALELATLGPLARRV